MEHMRYKLAFIVMAIAILAGCEASEEFSEGTKFGGETEQALLLSMLNEAEIDYKLDKDGFIRYQSKHKSVVEALQLQIIQSSSSRHGHTFGSEEEVVKFIAFLHSKGFPAEKTTLHQGNRVSWKEVDETAIKKLLYEFEVEYKDYLSSQRGINGL